MTGRPALRTLCTPSPGHVSAGRAPDPALAPAAPPPSCAAPGPTPGPKRPAERGGARGADWWIQKFKPNSSEGAPRTGKGRRHPVAREWAGWVGQRMVSATGRNWKELEGGASSPSAVGCGGRGCQVYQAEARNSAKCTEQQPEPRECASPAVRPAPPRVPDPPTGRGLQPALSAQLPTRPGL